MKGKRLGSGVGNLFVERRPAMSRRLMGAVVVGLVLGLVTSASATTYYVGGNNQGANWWSATWANVQAAFNAAGAGDEVRISG